MSKTPGPINREQMERYLRRVGQYLHEKGLIGEILLVGGAYMTLVVRQRETTKDVDAYFAAPAEEVRDAATCVPYVTFLASPPLPKPWTSSLAMCQGAC